MGLGIWGIVAAYVENFPLPEKVIQLAKDTVGGQGVAAAPTRVAVSSLPSGTIVFSWGSNQNSVKKYILSKNAHSHHLPIPKHRQNTAVFRR